MARKQREEFTLEERQRIHVMRRRGCGFAEIGQSLNRDPKVVKRASRRYQPENPIVRREQTALERAKWDHEQCQARRRKAKQRVRLKTRERQQYVEERLGKASPEQIAGRYKLEHPGERFSHESIYQWIYRDRPDLAAKLELVSKRGNRKRNTNRRYRFKEPAAPKTSITLRPEGGNNRTECGHFERDTVMGKKSTGACVLNITERLSRVAFLAKLHACNADAVSSATLRRLKPLPEELRRSMTQDNGSENSNHAKEEQELKMSQFFCHPYSAFERGTVEVVNRFAVRRPFPKGTDFSTVNFKQIEEAETLFNNTPRKVLGFRTPLEVFAEYLKPYNLTPEDVGLRRITW